MSTPEPRPYDLALTAESVEKGAEPGNALYIDRGWAPDPPEAADELDTAYGAAQARRQLAEALAALREPEAKAEAEGEMRAAREDPEPEIEA